MTEYCNCVHLIPFEGNISLKLTAHGVSAASPGMFLWPSLQVVILLPDS